MGRERISRRDCLALLGAGAAAALTPATAYSGQSADKVLPPDSGRHGGPIAVQSLLEELKELSAQRVFAPTPVELRPEYAAGQSGVGGG